MRYLLIIWLLLIAGCSSQENSSAPITSTTMGVTRDDRSKSIYFFQHRQIPNWLFNTDGEFYDDMYAGFLGRLLAAASEIVDEDYSSKIIVESLEEKNAVLITFPSPDSMPNFYFALLIKNENGFSYFTYEKTIPSDDNTVVGVVGGWDSEGSHLNYGPRSYSSAKMFVDDVMAN